MLENFNKCLKNKTYDPVVIPEDLTILLQNAEYFSLVVFIGGINLCSKSSGKSPVIEIIDKSLITSTIEALIEFYREKIKQNNMKNNRSYLELIYSTYIPTVNLLKEGILNGNIKIVSKDNDRNLYEFFDSIEKTYMELKEEIFNYSYEYERQKYRTIMSKHTVGNISDSVYDGYFQPKAGIYIYTARSEHPLKVLQSIPGGVLLVGIGTNSTIYLKTSKNYVDNQIIPEDFIAEFSRYFEYITVNNANKKIRTFTELDSKKTI